MATFPDSKQLYIADLCQRLDALEQGRLPMNALDYRVHARMLRHALAGVPRTRLAPLLHHAPVREILSNRLFEEQETLLSEASSPVHARLVRAQTDVLLARMRGAARAA